MMLHSTKHILEKVHMKLLNNSVVTIKGNNLEVSVMPLGATLISMRYASSPNVVVQYQDLDMYQSNPVYLGTMVGPIAGRTKNGQIQLDERVLQLSKNDEPNHLHGGKGGIHHHVFNIKEQSESKVVFEDTLKHQEDGYPGSIHYLFIYEIVEDSLVISIEATPSECIPLNITNHSYFNLEGSNTLKNHQLKIQSDEIALSDTTNANTGEFLAVKDTDFDFNSYRNIGKDRGHLQFETTRYVDHDFKLKGKVYLQTNDYDLEIDTDAPYMRVYTANWFDESFVAEHGAAAKNQSAVAFEPQLLANGYNILQSNDYLFDSKKPFRSETRYKLKEK